MIQLITKFVSSCRAAGLRVSSSEVLDCVNQLKLIDILDEPQFNTVLRTNFAKSRREQSKFDRLYHLFFKEMRQCEEIAHADSIADEIQSVLDMLKSKASEQNIPDAVLDFMQGDPVSFLEMLTEIQSDGNNARKGLGSNLGSVVRRMPVMMSFEKVRDLVDQHIEDNKGKIYWENRKNLRTFFDDRIASLKRLFEKEDRPDNFGLEKVNTYEQYLKTLGERSFNSLTPKEAEDMREVVEQLVRKLKDVITLRYAATSRGVLDVKKTLRHSSKYNGVPIEIFFRKQPKRKGKIVVLCDVSSSVWSAAKFMLNMLYSLQECFTKVRSFIFVAGLEEVTKIFENHEINLAISKVLYETDLQYNAPTDYGLTFRQFKSEYMDALNKKTTLIMIGDGRSNYANPERDIVEEIREKCRRLIWLNPETRQFWYTGDSEMRIYEAYCHEVRQCQNLNQLVDFIKDLVL